MCPFEGAVIQCRFPAFRAGTVPYYSLKQQHSFLCTKISFASQILYLHLSVVLGKSACIVPECLTYRG